MATPTPAWRRVAGALGLAVALAAASPGCGDEATRAAPPSAPLAHPSVFFDAGSFALARRRATPARPAPGARAVIVPHHWLAGHLILQGLRDMGAGRRVERIVLLSPNHIGAGGAAVTTSDRPWATPLGTVEPDRAAVEALAAAGGVVVAPDVLTHEHGVAGLMPALASELPRARVVPLAISGLPLHGARHLAAAILPLLGETTVVVASVDFSHYLAAEEAEVRDTDTLRALRALDSSAVAGFTNDHLDSPASIVTLMETMRLAGATRFELRHHANSAQLVGRAPSGVTSYISGFYLPAA